MSKLKKLCLVNLSSFKIHGCKLFFSMPLLSILDWIWVNVVNSKFKTFPFIKNILLHVLLLPFDFIVYQQQRTEWGGSSWQNDVLECFMFSFHSLFMFVVFQKKNHLIFIPNNWLM